VFFEGAFGFADLATPENAKAVPIVYRIVPGKNTWFSEDAAKRHGFGKKLRETAMYNFSKCSLNNQYREFVKVYKDSLGLAASPRGPVSFG
jgi:hypothetical protein